MTANPYASAGAAAIKALLEASGQRTETYTVNGPLALLTIGHLQEPPEWLMIRVGDIGFGSQVSLTIDLRPLLAQAGLLAPGDARRQPAAGDGAPRELRETLARAICTVDERNGGPPWEWHASQRRGHEMYYEYADAILPLWPNTKQGDAT